MAHKDKKRDAAREKDREKWMARFQVRLAMQPGCPVAQATGGAPEPVTPTLLCALLVTDSALPW